VRPSSIGVAVGIERGSRVWETLGGIAIVVGLGLADLDRDGDRGRDHLPEDGIGDVSEIREYHISA
jgi:hypothetical protein